MRVKTERGKQLEALSKERILVLDGAMGTMIQQKSLTEVDYRGKAFENHACDVKGNNDLLNLTRPDVIQGIHRQFLDAGADIIETNTFSGTSIAQTDYQLVDRVYDINYQGAKLARDVANQVEKENSGRVCFVAGALGPTNRTASMSPDVNNPAFRNITFDALKNAYREAAEALLAGGADILLVETVFDTLNCKAALFAIDELLSEIERDVPLMISGTITDQSGRTLSGQTPEAFWYSVSHAKPFSVGFNCALGAAQMRPFALALSNVADTRICIYPNAGLPNELGEYEETPEELALHIEEWADFALLNLVGGCCGTMPSHIKAVFNAVSKKTPRVIPKFEKRLCLSGLEPFVR